jgi:hypothetical protein
MPDGCTSEDPRLRLRVKVFRSGHVDVQLEAEADNCFEEGRIRSGTLELEIEERRHNKH